MSRIHEHIHSFFEDNASAQASALELAHALKCSRATLHKVLRDMRVAGELEYEAVLKLGSKGSACKEYVYRRGPNFVERKKERSRSIVQSALQNRGALLDAWWPIKAANQQQKREAA